ncbi:HD-GYP domain-containing protein [Alteromonas sp. IB21]|uniref:HD-GYP domain-containing protein n=1 Tax=Alteromonas sp. IB21 TaxID=2779369 RepID=UPI0018E70CEA|nr:HD-GYP domain-containing protein [Alteromonas sp. IB21]MBJ2128067.1 HD-GYP domain-containing protein [Alteromonas sp. IB21]
MLEQVPIDELQPGMYVNQVLEQTGSLRMRSKGIVKTQAIIDSLKSKGILRVEVDLTKSKHSTKENKPEQPVESEVPKPKAKPVGRDSINQANDLYSSALSIQSNFLKSLKNGAVKDLSPMESLSHSLIESVFDNKDALSCLTMIKDTDQYLLEHSINCSVLSGIFCEFLGYDRDIIEQVSLGTLLMDIGMSSLPDEIRNGKGEFAQGDWEVMKTHVQIGVDLVEQCGDISDLSLRIIEEHHERIDGSGYPRGLVGEEISEYARIAAIVDAYDAMTSNRSHKESITPTQALKRLTAAENLDQDLVKQFIQCIGVHPVGSLVRLKSGKLGIVSKINPKDPVSPHVMTFYSVTSQHFNEVKRIDLSLYEDEIVSGVRPEEFSLNLPKFFRDVFVNQIPI